MSSQWRSPLAVPEHLLEEQLLFLHRRGYIGLTFAEAERRRSAGALPKRSLVVTFDDGFASTLRAKPILDSLGFPATVSVVTSFVDSGRPLRWPGLENDLEPGQEEEARSLSWREVETLVESGWEVGSHTVTHPLLTQLSDEDLAHELELSRATIVDRLGSCQTVAYPYGLGNERVAAAAERAGYRAASMLTGAHLVDEPYRRQRVGLSAADQGLRLRLQVSRAGLALRRSPLASLVRRLRFRRTWLPAAPR